MTHTCRWTLAILLALTSTTAALAQQNAASKVATQVAQPAEVKDAETAPAENTVVEKNVRATVPMARGVELTKRAETMTDPAEKAASLRAAEQIYTEALKADPKSGAALNNLAVLAARDGNSDAARKYFEDAIASDDGHKALYALNYSKLLQTSDTQGAIQAARLAVKEAPYSRTAKEQLGALLWQTNPAELIPLANELITQGESELATRYALQCLMSQTRPEAERRAWLILLATRLAREYAISENLRRSLGEVLAKLESDPIIGIGAQQLRAVVDTPPKSGADVSWWGSQTSAPATGMRSGRATMRDVLLAAGESYSQQDFRRAERYFMAAVELGDRGPDPDAFLRLVELYASNDKSEQLTTALQQLAALMNRYEFEMYSEKSAAYAERDWPLIYRMHVALGMTYAYLKTWTSQSNYQNAIFQLRNAMIAAERANKDLMRRDALLALPPVAVEMLAEGYLATGRKDLALQVRIDGAAALDRVGHARDSARVIRQIAEVDVATLDAESRVKYEDLRSKLPEG